MAEQGLVIVEQAEQQIVQTQPVHYGFDEILKMATAIARGQLFGVKNVDQAISLMLIAQAEGLHPATAARDYNIIDGKASKTADAMLASFQAAGGTVEWIEMTDTKCSASFMHPKTCPKPLVVDWDIQRAQRAKLTNKNNWQNYPRAMLRARVTSEALKAVFPAALSGMYTPEEVRDFDEPAQLRKEASTLRDEAEAIRDVTGSSSYTASEYDKEADRIDKVADRNQQVQQQPAAHQQPAQAQQPAAPRQQPPAQQPVRQAQAAPQVRKDPLPTGEQIVVNIKDGQMQNTDRGSAYTWTAEYDDGQGRIAQNRIWCWHRSQPVNATGQDNPERFCGPVDVVLKEQGVAEGKPYYSVEAMTMHIGPPMDMDSAPGSYQ